MLKLNDLIENFELAKEILSNWKYDSDTLDECFECFRISSNAVYPFKQDGRLCFLRFAPIKEKIYSNILGEIEFIQYLLANNYPALEPIKAKNGEFVLKITTSWGEFIATAFYGVSGECIEDTDFSKEVCFSYGKSLGLLHKLSKNYTPSVKKQTFEDILSLIENRLNEFDSELLEVVDDIRIELSKIPTDDNHYGLVHYDFECDNVFYDEKTKSCNVIDFDDSIYHFYALDIEQAIDSIKEEAPDDLCDDAIRYFIDGYKTEFLFDESISSLLPLMRKFCDLYSYTRLMYCLSDPVNKDIDWMVDLEVKLRNKAKYLKNKLYLKN